MNKYQPHIYILCEDDANRQIVNGFVLDPSLNVRVIQVLPLARGWEKVRDDFADTHIKTMSQYAHRHMVLVVDFDGVNNRLEQIKQVIPPILEDRVFVLGVLKEPEDLPSKLGTLEQIGQNLAKDCRENTNITWGHELLKHNAEELKRMTPILKPILFP